MANSLPPKTLFSQPRATDNDSFYVAKSGIQLIMLAGLLLSACFGGSLLFRMLFPVSFNSTIVHGSVCGIWETSADTAFETYPGHSIDITSISPTDIWAIDSNEYPSWKPLLEHWDGTKWSLISLDSPISPDVSLQVQAISATSANDVWVVGNTMNSTYTSKPFALHWDGTRWSGSATFQGLNDFKGFSSLVALAPDDVWAGGGGSLAAHWDGQKWSAIPWSVGLDKAGMRLWEVAGLSPDAIWTVPSSDPQVGAPLKIPWAGAIDNPFLNLNGDKVEYVPEAISGVTPRDIWAVGNYARGTYSKGAIVHWDGASWKTVPVPLPTNYSELDDIRDISSDDVWAVGDGRIVLHWDGTTWKEVPGPELFDYNSLKGIDSIGPDEIWVTGVTWHDCDGCYYGNLMMARFARKPCTLP